MVEAHDSDRGDDDRLLISLRAGTDGAFEVLVDRYHPRLTAYLHQLLNDVSVAEDIAQETFIAVFTSLHTLTDDRTFEAWLFRIARNRARMYLRRRTVLEFVSLEHVVTRLGGWLGRDQSSDIDTVSTRDAVHTALGRLSATEREALLLHSWAGFSSIEVAGILGIKPKAAAKRVTRARQRFADCYQEIAAAPRDLPRPGAPPNDDRERA